MPETLNIDSDLVDETIMSYLREYTGSEVHRLRVINEVPKLLPFEPYYQVQKIVFSRIRCLITEKRIVRNKKRRTFRINACYE